MTIICNGTEIQSGAVCWLANSAGNKQVYNTNLRFNDRFSSVQVTAHTPPREETFGQDGDVYKNDFFVNWLGFVLSAEERGGGREIERSDQLPLVRPSCRVQACMYATVTWLAWAGSGRQELSREALNSFK
jgi:hypothetical protein